MSEIKQPQLDHPIERLLAERWSPYAFEDRRVEGADLAALFEAARWAASSRNEQPWRFLVATRDDPEQHARLASCLLEGNHAWAHVAPVLVLALIRTDFTYNGQPNRTAGHDLGLAVGNLTVEATARGLAIHQMAGILPDRARELFDVPEGFEPVTVLAIGYAGDADDGPLAKRDRSPRSRRPLAETVFGGRFGRPYPLTT